jgi:hypothetical protein
MQTAAGKDVEQHKGQAPGWGLLLAGAFVAEKLKKRAVSPQPRTSKLGMTQATSKPEQGPGTKSKREEAEAEEAEAWAKLTPPIRRDVLDACTGGMARPQSTYAKRDEDGAKSSRRRKTVLEKVSRDPGKLMSRAYT